MKNNNWDKFWGNRKVPLTEKLIGNFANNYEVIAELVKTHWQGASLFNKEIISLEVGSGRGTLSDFFEGYGWETHRCDIGDHQLNQHPLFKICDVFELNEVYEKGAFDVVFTYGLLEHFGFKGQMEVLDKVIQATKPGGISVHYVVPWKMTNINEDNSVYRDACRKLRSVLGEENMVWVFPAMKIGNWKTNKWLGKGFFFVVTE
jgi:cyclopropane fatty-acyl-phospholipid synthase-like methyltransferase